jgi:hypothetical protein
VGEEERRPVVGSVREEFGHTVNARLDG